MIEIASTRRQRLSGIVPRGQCGAISSKGFTLVELLVVLVIASVVLTLVGTSISRNISGAEMRTAAQKMTASLRYTRTRAILDKEEQVFLVDTENRRYTAPKRPEVELPGDMQVALTTARSELTSEAVGGIRFYPDGGSTGGFVELEANDRIYRINVAWLTGEASIQKVED
jgi:general secretion pathway protein H